MKKERKRMEFKLAKGEIYIYEKLNRRALLSLPFMPALGQPFLS